MTFARPARLVLALAAVASLAACRTTPLDNIWPGCATCEVPAQPAAAPATPCEAEAVPTSVEFDERVSPAVDCNPVRTQHTLVVTVRDQFGNPMPGQRVEWILARYPEAVGDIVAHDDQYGVGSIAPIAGAAVGNNGNKVDNHYALSVTNYDTESIDAGNNYPYASPGGARLPDIAVARGQSWITFTSGREGVTELIAYVPAIRDGTRHKVWAKKIWADADVRFPADATNVLPTDTHAFAVSLVRSDGSGIPGQPVEAEILDGPEAVFTASNARTVRVETNALGVAEVVLKNVAGQPGANRVRLTALGAFYGETCPRSRIVTKTWQRATLAAECGFPEGALAAAGRPFAAYVAVRNTGDAPAEGVTAELQLPAGLMLVEGGPFPAALGTLAPGQEARMALRLVGEAEGAATLGITARDARGAATARSECPVEVVMGRLSITKACQPARAATGSEVRFVVTVQNTGRGPLDEVVVTDAFPEGITPLSQPTAALGSLAPGESLEVEFAGRAERAGTFTNTARAVAARTAEVTSTCTLQVVECRLEMSLVGPEKIYYGEEATYQLVVRNTGDGEAEGCVVRITNGGCLGGGFQDFNVGPLAPGQSFTQEWQVVARSVGACSVSAESTCGQRCAVKADVAMQVTGLPALQVEMTDKAVDGSEGGVFNVGQTFIYRLRVENDMGTDATPDMYVQWNLPAELEFVSGRAMRDGVTVGGQAQTARTGGFSLRVGEGLDFEILVRVLAAPDSAWVKTVAEVRRASDNAELAAETESTSLRR